MGKCYFEVRANTTRNNGISTDMMRHLHTRQYLGKAVVIGLQPVTTLSAARKQWLKLSRYIQKQRAGTLDADKILKYTHTVTHMQHMSFTAKTPADNPDADVYFMSPRTIETVPSQCLSVYIATKLTTSQFKELLKLLPDDALLVDYAAQGDLKNFGLQPKASLETAVETAWEQLEQFFSSYHIHIEELTDGPLQDVDAMEEALDILLGASHRFLQIAGNFQHALELARPLRLTKVVRRRYDAAALLAHRVQALSTNGFSGQFLEAYNEDDTFFLYDRARELSLLDRENISRMIARQLAAGRYNLAKALQNHAQLSKFTTSP